MFKAQPSFDFSDESGSSAPPPNSGDRLSSQERTAITRLQPLLQSVPMPLDMHPLINDVRRRVRAESEGCRKPSSIYCASGDPLDLDRISLAVRNLLTGERAAHIDFSCPSPPKVTSLQRAYTDAFLLSRRWGSAEEIADAKLPSVVNKIRSVGGLRWILIERADRLADKKSKDDRPLSGFILDLARGADSASVIVTGTNDLVDWMHRNFARGSVKYDNIGACDDFKAMGKYLSSLAKRVEFKEQFDPTSQPFAEAILKASAGAWAHAATLFREAAELAIYDEAERLEYKYFFDAFQRFSPGGLNPFKKLCKTSG